MFWQFFYYHLSEQMLFLIAEKLVCQGVFCISVTNRVTYFFVFEGRSLSIKYMNRIFTLQLSSSSLSDIYPLVKKPKSTVSILRNA